MYKNMSLLCLLISAVVLPAQSMESKKASSSWSDMAIIDSAFVAGVLCGYYVAFITKTDTASSLPTTEKMCGCEETINQLKLDKEKLKDQVQEREDDNSKLNKLASFVNKVKHITYFNSTVTAFNNSLTESGLNQLYYAQSAKIDGSTMKFVQIVERKN